MGENTFRRPCNFKELRVVKRAHITTFALCAWWQPLYRIGRRNISTWQRPTELFRARLIHHARSWLHLQSHWFGYSKLSAMQMSSRYVRCAPNAVDDKSRDHHAERSSVLVRCFWPLIVR